MSKGGFTSSAIITVAAGGGPVAVDNSNANSGIAVGNLDTTLTVGTLTNGIIVCCIAFTSAGTPPTVSSVTDTDGAMTFLTASAQLSTNYREAGIYYRLAPSAGSHTASVVASAASDDFAVGLVSFSNVSQSAPFGTPNLLDRSSSTTTDQAIATALGDMVLAYLLAGSSGLASQNVTAGAQRFEVFPGNFGSATIGGTIAGTGGTDTVSFSHDAGTNLSVGVALKKA